jgi:hypothetical protein
VVDAALKRYAWPALAAVALCYLVALGLTGGRPGPGLAAFEPRGLLREVRVEAISAIELSADGRSWRFERTPAGAWRVARGPPIAALARELPLALTLLRNSGPERTLKASEIAAASVSEFGLDKPRVTVAIYAGPAPPLVIAFGGANALTSIRYARVVGDDDVVLLPAFVAEAWERLAGIP